MEPFTIKRGDTAPSLAATLKVDDAAADLSGCSVRFVVRRLLEPGTANRRDGDLKFDSPATIVDAVNGAVRYDWAPGDTDIEGTFRGEFKVTDINGRTTTYPSKSHLLINVLHALR